MRHDRLAMQIDQGTDGGVIFTFAPDGSNFRHVITGVLSPWSPDGSQIAYSSSHGLVPRRRRVYHPGVRHRGLRPLAPRRPPGG